MIFLAIIIGIIFIFLIIQCIQWNDEGESYSFGICYGWLMGALCILEILLIFERISKGNPTAMDVYQGKTTIKYTIRDGIKVDSVVVFKENNYGTED